MWEYDECANEPGPTAQFTEHAELPIDAQLMGLDRNTEEGAMVAMAGSFSPAKLSHRIIAYLLLLSFAVPHVGILLEKIF
jgi:hypothetical protein